jgi:hypothetical protein
MPAATPIKPPVRWKELSALFDEFIGLDPPRRAARLESLRRQDSSLAEELVAVLAIATQADRRAFLAHSPRLDDPDMADLPARPAASRRVVPAPGYRVPEAARGARPAPLEVRVRHLAPQPGATRRRPGPHVRRRRALALAAASLLFILFAGLLLA